MQQSRGWTSSLLVLIPKIESASQWRDFQPISLCNVGSKIISKILANHLNRLLQDLILPWQTGFVPRRGIFDNILLAQELIHELDRRLVDPNLVLKLDLDKAYDRVDWSFLLFMLRQFGFDEQVVDLLFRTFSNSWFSILINGEAVGFFKSTQGVRQGDPIFPALFLFVAEFLGRDDTIIFTRCSADTLTAIKDLLPLYQACSGQKRIYWDAWEKVCFPVGEIGLGFRSFDAVVNTFSCKLWWYPYLVVVDHPSPVWRRLVQVRDLAEGNIRWSLGEGLVNFWHDRWCTDVPLATLVPGSACPHMLVVELYRPHRWDEHRLRQFLPGHIVTQILKLRIFLGRKDKMVWGASSSGAFTVASAWEQLWCEKNLSTVHSLVWSTVVPLKVSFFTWRLLHRWVPLDHAF
ncbi:uncharacterized protein [Coffea arabica]|uniref:Reverse transcriptase domain-containing protein n=1 Tax=Coffea arabica TaxID=13443 RepID=A0ABM4U137_COFAR